MGINISIPKELLNNVDGNPGNLSDKEVNINNLISKVAFQLVDNISQYQKDGLINFVERWNVCMFARNENVELKYKNKKIIGKAIGIDESGNLLIEKNSKILTVNDTNYSMRVSG